MTLLLPNAQQQFCDGNGIPLAGGFVYTYAVGTTTPVTTYSDYLQTVPNTNPIVLDGNGRCQLWATGAIQQLVTDQYGNQIWNQVTSDGSINPASQFAPISGSVYYAPATGSPNYAPISGSTYYAASNGNASNTFLAANATAANMVATLGQVQAQGYNFSIDSGTTNALVGTLSPAIGGYTDGEEVLIRVLNTNTGAATLNVNGVGAASIALPTGVGLVGGELVAGKTALFVWQAVSSTWLLVNSALASVSAITTSITGSSPKLVLNGGFAIIGGSFTASENGSGTLSFANGGFANACSVIVGTPSQSNVTNSTFAIAVVSKTQFSWGWPSTGTGSYNVNYIALGY